MPTRSSPALWDNKYIFANDNGEIIALNSFSGDSIYVYKIEGSFFSGSTIVDGTIYIGNNNGKLYALNVEDGKVIWEFNSNSRILMTPAVDDENVVFGNLAGSLFSLNKLDGSLNWKTEFRGVLNSTPLITKNKIIVPEVFFSFHIVDKEGWKHFKRLLFRWKSKVFSGIFPKIFFL